MARNVRKRMIEGALSLMARRGVQATSFTEVINATGAPRGSIYHHFPGGKSEMIVAAIDETALRRQNAIVELPTNSPAELTAAYTKIWRDYVEENDFRAGTAPAAVATAPEDEAQLEHTRELYNNALEYLAAAYVRSGVDAERAKSLAASVTATLEGAVILARVQQSFDAFDRATSGLEKLVECVMTAE